VDEYLADSGNGERDDNDRLDDTDWRVGVYARFPLFEGGKKKARSGRLEEEVSLLHNDQSAAAEAISQGVLRALNRTRASYPSITLTRQAAEAARKNFDLVTDSYVQGIKSIVDLLDAQNQSLNADLNAANAVYDFLIDYMGVERALGEFTIFMPEEQRRAWLEKAQQAIGMKP
jgi:outer membrane protein TolC